MYHILSSSFRVSSKFDIWMLASPKPHMPAHIGFSQPQDGVVQCPDLCLFGPVWHLMVPLKSPHADKASVVCTE